MSRAEKEATPERIEKARQLILAGSSYKEAAAAVGLAVNTIGPISWWRAGSP